MTELFLGRGAERRPVTLGPLLGEGAAGKVYSIVEMRGAAAKIYHGAAARQYEAKVDAMLASPPDLPPATHRGIAYPQIAWPQAKLFDRSGRFVGFLMPEIDFARSTSLVNLLQKSSRRVEKLSEYYGYRVLVARNLASVFAELHRAGHHMIDMKPANLRFYPAVSWMAVVDTDGFSIQGRGGRIGAEQVSDDYIAPESWQRSPGELGIEQDLFALAVIIFQLLNNGVHPFSGGSGSGDQATDLQTRILQGVYAYGLAPLEGATPSQASIHRMFRRGTRVMFDCAFLPGDRRPSAEEWRDHLDALMEKLVPCTAKPEEHAHFGSGCGFCGHEARISAAKVIPLRPRTERPRAASSQQPQATPSRLPAARKAPGVPPALPPRSPSRAMVAYVPVHAARNRSNGGRWAGLVVLAGLAGALFVSQDQWRPLLAGLGPAGARAAAIGDVSAATPGPPAALETFPSPRGYRVLPAAGALTVPLRLGPGEEYAEVERLDLHDTVVATGSSSRDGGPAWLWVMRERDGATGFVLADALRPRAGEEGATQKAAATTQAERDVDARYGELMAKAGRYDRAYLAEMQRMWEGERQRCAETADPASCRSDLLAQRRRELEGWAAVEAPPPSPVTPAALGKLN
ncbi:hypothetical protein ACFQ1E_05460 [Sphingomonas canadensis]|uniref:Protein kinase domain-containing protein n=1 Tax=Sphingomonas canadensis TaxID=1219257 RepID=A0ABW3H3J6_9SPHN|nr:hypothetical protein [Sphingomonas canadensis]MCW3835764.1 hypothetical protein [Sphingomonas canadensis]